MADDTTLAELFARDPFSLTKEEIDRIVKHYREARKNFVLGGKGKAEGKPSVNLEELGLT